ncbi:MAG: 1-deoxy-D-xylulose-5-phosphate reductoisomerase [Candidatus Ratteibacteria bacterium]|jgi:1-deoxy-D-xylulose-5-phosphate reductoisomerase
MKKVAIFGSTGSIGCTTLEVVRMMASEFTVCGLAAGYRYQGFGEQIREFSPLCAALPVNDESLEREFSQTRFFSGSDALEKVVEESNPDVVVMAIPGLTGLSATLRALSEGKIVVMATKEIIISAWPLLLPWRAQILPADSEHNAIFQILARERTSAERITITASGGALYNYTGNMDSVTIEQVLDHPVWKMGKKITVDSATLMNKGIEMIEAAYLFDLSSEKIDILLHPQALVHGMVFFSDGFMHGVFSLPDMKYSLAYCLSWPLRAASCDGLLPLDFQRSRSLTFSPVDTERFPSPHIARQALEKGMSFPTVLNAANEVAVTLFLENKITFSHIPVLIEKALERHIPGHITSVEDVMEADAKARESVRFLLGG